MMWPFKKPRIEYVLSVGDDEFLMSIGKPDVDGSIRLWLAIMPKTVVRLVRFTWRRNGTTKRKQIARFYFQDRVNITRIRVR